MQHESCCLEKLTLADRVLFDQFGKGPKEQIPFTLIHHAFEQFADLHPEVVAVRHHDTTSITYGELERRSNNLSNKLAALGLLPRQRVCLVFQRSIHMVVAILAVLKANCQYVPLDGGVVPDETLSHILGDTGAPMVICLKKFESKVRACANNSTSILAIDADDHDILHGTSARPESKITSSDGAYIIYTSGTTGKPKGVDVTHMGLTNALCLRPSNLNIQVGSKVAQLLSISFDMAAWEILGALTNGGTLCLRGSNWDETLRQIDTVIATPSILGRFQKRDYKNIKTIVVGGEPCPRKLADEWAIDTTFYNICGPTEITILNTAHLHLPGKDLSIGKPIPNTNVYILDEEETPVPIGSVGLMWVGGSGVSRGYLNLPELTSKRYKFDKFTQNGVMFNTGDLVRWREDGTLEHHGRIDDQVKFKGFRVELDGVSRTIERYPEINKACTLMIGDALCAFYSAPVELRETAIFEFVSKNLPYYAVPTRWRYLPLLPLTPNGKIDKQTLRNIVSDETLPSPVLETNASIQNPSTGQDDRDLEKGIIVRSSETLNTPSTVCSFEKKPYELPNKNGLHGQRWLRHRFFSLYRRLFSVVLIANVAAMLVLVHQTWRSGFISPATLATAASINLVVSVLMRQDHVINLFFAVATSVPTWVPLSIRRHCARVYHIGGLHSGCAVAAVFWFLVFTVTATRYTAIRDEDCSLSPAALAVTYLILLLFAAILAMAHPYIRAKWHNQFEISHRFAGWTALALLWVQTTLVTDSLRGSMPLGKALLVCPSLWALVVATSSIIYPWLHLRKVNVRPELLSNHAIRLHFDYCSTIPGTAVRISENPLLEWHAFATIAQPGVKGFSLVVSKAGDWTGRTINRVPTKIWKRGVPACGVLAIAPLFKKIVLVATGSGIGPCLPVILAKKVPCRIVWSTPHPEQTFGKEIVDAVRDTDPDAVIHNTRTQGKPDLVAIAYRLYVESDAEAICIISNQKFTQKVIYAMESRGIPAFGAIWDS